MKVTELRKLLTKTIVKVLLEAKRLEAVPKAAPTNNILVTHIGKWVIKTYRAQISDWFQGNIQDIASSSPEEVYSELQKRILRGSIDISEYIDNDEFGNWFGTHLERIFSRSHLDVTFNNLQGMYLDVQAGELKVTCRFWGEEVDPDVEAPDRAKLKDAEMSQMLTASGAQETKVSWQLKKHEHSDYYFYIDYSVHFTLRWNPGQGLLDPSFVKAEIEKNS